MDMESLLESLRDHEDLRLLPYRDTVGKLTIGYGRNLDDRGITKDEAESMLQTDAVLALKDASLLLTNFHALRDARQNVLAEMVFNLGKVGVEKFKKFLEAAEIGHHDTAADEMLDSLWARQVGRRAVILSERWRIGV